MKRLLLAGVTAALLAGCAYDGSYGPYGSAHLIDANYHASDALIAIAGPQLDPARPIIVATVVDIDDLERSSTLGRYIAESVSARFTQGRYRMVEMKLQKAVYMKRGEGELMLTREVREIAAAHQAQAVVVGTYSRGHRNVYVNLKIVQPQTNLVLAAYDYAVPMNRDVCGMIQRDPRACIDSWR